MPETSATVRTVYLSSESKTTDIVDWSNAVTDCNIRYVGVAIMGNGSYRAFEDYILTRW